LRLGAEPLEQTVAGADVPATIGFENNGRPRPADTGIDHAQKHGSRRKPLGKGCQQVGGCLGIADWRISEWSIAGTAGANWCSTAFI